MRTLAVSMLALTLLAGGAWLFYRYGVHEPARAMAFINAYAEYAERADMLEALSNAPGAAGNAARQTLHAELSKALAAEISPPERAAAAEAALIALATVKRGVDRAQSSAADVYRLIDEADSAARALDDADNAEAAQEIVALIRTRQEAFARMTSLLSATNDESEAILTRILAENGELSVAHITAINEDTAGAEARYEKVTELSRELAVIRSELSLRYQTFAEEAL